jgi:VWFA-related protein
MHDARRPVLGLMCAGILGCACILAAQAPRQPAFQSRVVLVPVDVRVLDAEGMPLTGLTSADFAITEDGKPQKIAHFESYALQPAPAPPDEPALRPRSSTPLAELAAQQHRVFLIVLGTGRLNEPSKGPEAMARFIRERLLPQDRVAVLTWWNRATDFTTDHGRVASVVDRFKVAHEAIWAGAPQRPRDLGVADGNPEARLSPREMRAWVFGGSFSQSVATKVTVPGPSRPGNRGMNDYVADEMGRLSPPTVTPGGTMQERKASNGPPAALDDMSYEAFVKGFIVPFNLYLDAAPRNQADLSVLLTGIDYLRRVEGEKHLIFMSERPVYTDRLEVELGIGAVASDARIVLHTVQTGGMPGAPALPSFEVAADMAGPTLAQVQGLNNLKTLSEVTGGISSTTAYAERAANRIDAATRSGYVLGYYPADARWDGTYRRIAVRVNRKGATVLFRHGYYAKESFTPPDRRAFFAFNRIAAAAARVSDNRSIPITVESAASARNAKGVLEASVDVTIDLSQVIFGLDGDRHLASLDIAVLVGNRKDTIVGEVWQRAELSLKPDTYERLMREGLRRTVRVPLKGPAANVKVMVYHYADDRIGSVTAKLQSVK